MAEKRNGRGKNKAKSVKSKKETTLQRRKKKKKVLETIDGMGVITEKIVKHKK